jgi:long-chain acyl-CoA synthetase
VFAEPLFEEVTRAIPNAEEVDVGASGHMGMLERRDAVNRAMNRFMESSSRLTWRETETTAKDVENTSWARSRPWLPHYDEGVPHTIAIPRVPLHHMLDSSIRRFPNHMALRFEGSRITYKQLGQEVNRFANLLLGLGLEKGDRVMLLLPNLPQMVIAYFGTLKAGGVAVFTMPTTQPEELLRQVRDCGSRILVTLTQFDGIIHQIKNELEQSGISPLKHIILTNASDYLPAIKRVALKLNGGRHKTGLPDISMGAQIHYLSESLQSQSRDYPAIEISPHELAIIIYTGGTTDAPKGVMLSHRNLIANTIQTRHWMPHAEEGRERFLCVLPFTHSYGMTTTLNVPIAIGATLILKAKFEVLDVLNTIKRHRPTIFPGVPQMYVTIKDFPGVRKFGIDSINACISGSAPFPAEVQEAFEKLTRGRLVEGYGLTEASPVTHGNPLFGMRKVGSIGIPFPSTEAHVVDLRRNQKVMPTGQIGELAIRGPQIMLGYWEDEEATQQTVSRDGWLLTGDVAQMDSDGYFRIISRKADMWYPAKADEPAFPRDIEEVLFEVPQVKEAAVVAIAGQPIAFVIARKDRPSADSLLAYCQRRLPPELVPRLVIFVDDFPRTFIGKVLRRELARKFEERQPANE